MKNEMTLAFDSRSENEGFARVAVAAFVTQLNPTLEEVADIRTAVSEAVTNAIIHGYPDGIHTVVVRALLSEDTIEVWVTDEGVGMEDVKQAMEPLYTSRPELERSGMVSGREYGTCLEHCETFCRSGNRYGRSVPDRSYGAD